MDELKGNHNDGIKIRGWAKKSESVESVSYKENALENHQRKVAKLLEQITRRNVAVYKRYDNFPFDEMHESVLYKTGFALVSINDAKRGKQILEVSSSSGTQINEQIYWNKSNIQTKSIDNLGGIEKDVRQQKIGECLAELTQQENLILSRVDSETTTMIEYINKQYCGSHTYTRGGCIYF